MEEQGYKKLEIYRMAHHLAVDIHRMTTALPRHELFEEGGQIRRSSKSVAAQIVEGYCLRNHKNEFLQYLNRAFASCHETVEHLELLYETGSLSDESLYKHLLEDYNRLCRMIYRFIAGVSAEHITPTFVREGSEESGEG